MELHDLKKKKETENAKSRLEDTRQKLAETFRRISKAEDELQESKNQLTRKLLNLNRIERNQSLKITKLNSDIESIQLLLQRLLDEEAELKRMNAEMEVELANCQETCVNSDVDFQKLLEDLEEQITTGYKQIQSKNDAQVMLEVGLSSLKSDAQIPFAENYLQEVMEKSVERSCRRREGINKESKVLDQALKETQDNINQMEGQLSGLKQKHSYLTKQLATKNKEN